LNPQPLLVLLKLLASQTPVLDLLLKGHSGKAPANQLGAAAFHFHAVKSLSLHLQ
jgi:hypothetical protein